MLVNDGKVCIVPREQPKVNRIKWVIARFKGRTRGREETRGKGKFSER